MANTIPNHVESFSQLIRWLADVHHRGAVHPMHERLGVSSAVVQLWAKGSVKNPSLGNLDRLAKAYGLAFDDVRSVVTRPPSEPAPLAPMSWPDGCSLCPTHQAELHAAHERHSRHAPTSAAIRRPRRRRTA